MKKKMLVTLLVVFVVASLLTTITPVPASAWHEECERAAAYGWHSWGQNILCLMAIAADIIEGGGGW